MIEELFVPYNEALSLKQLGFNEPCLSYYKNGEFSDILELVINSDMYDYSTEYIAVPLYQQAFKFFREKYGKNVLIFSDGFQWTFDIRWIDKGDITQSPTKFYPPKEVDRQMFDSYEDAELACLQKLIEICNDS